MGFMLFALASIATVIFFAEMSSAQPTLYSSSYDQSGYAHKIELISNDCTLNQDQYAIFFWHRFSFTTPKYQGHIKPMALARLTSSPTFSDSTNYSDRVIYVESNGVALTICSHDTVSSSKNVCKAINISAYRYDMEWVFMYLQYQREGLLSIYVKFLAQEIEINDTLSSVLNAPPSNYLGLFLGGSTFLSTALNGSFFHPSILLGHQSQISSLSGLKRIMSEQPPYDYIRDQHISITSASPLTANGIYTRIGLYGTFAFDSSVGSTPVSFLSVNGVDGIGGVVGSYLINAKIQNDSLEFSADNYNDLVNSADDAMDAIIVTYPLTIGAVYTYYIDLNLENNTIRISCNTGGAAPATSTFTNRKNFIPSKLILSKNAAFSAGRYFETNLVGAAYESNSTEYQITRTQDNTVLPEAIRLSLAAEIKQFSFCYWFRLSSMFPIFQSQSSNSVNLVSFPLISLNTSPTAITSCTQTSSLLSCNLFTQSLQQLTFYLHVVLGAYMHNYLIKYQAYNSATILESVNFDNASAEWQWNSSCFAYKSSTDSTPSITKAYQYIGTSYKETSVLSQNLVLTPITDLYLQMNFAGDKINKQFYNIRLAINSDSYSYLDELFHFSKYTANIPPLRGDNSLLVANVYPGQGTLASLISYEINGLQFIKENSITLWCKLASTASDLNIIKAYQDSTYTYTGHIFTVNYLATPKHIELKTYSKQSINTDDSLPTEVSLFIDATNCTLTNYFFVYSGFSKFVNSVRLGVICDFGGVMTRYDQSITAYHLPVHSFNLAIDPAGGYSGEIAQVRAYFGLSAFESRLFTEPNLSGKWECAYKTFSCSLPQISSTANSKKCKDSFAFDSVGQACTVQCPCGYFSDPSNAIPYTCVKCNLAAQNCLYCINNSNSQQCTFCDSSLTVVPPSGFFSPEVNKGQCQCTKSGFVSSVVGPCVLCNDPCKECSGTPTHCTKCSSLAYLSGSTCLCIDGYYMDASGICQLCGQFCLTCKNSASYCLSCYNYQFRILDSSTNSCVCDRNYAEVTNPLTSQFECAFCDPETGNILTSRYTCDRCDGNCFTCVTTKATCTSCDEAMRRQLNTTTNTCDCIAGYYSPGSNLACLKCPNVCKECTSAAYCTSCTEEKILTATSSTQTCICDPSQFYFTTSTGQCEVVSLKASLSDYYSTTSTNVMHFRIYFNNPIDQAASYRPSQVVTSFRMDGLDNAINPILAVRKQSIQPYSHTSKINGTTQQQHEELQQDDQRMLASSADQSFYVSMKWENSSVILVDIEFKRSFMQKQLVMKFAGNQFVTSAAAGGHFLLTQNLTLPINLAVYTPADDVFTNVIENMIGFSNSISNSDNWIVVILMYLFRECYLILLAFPFFQTVLVLLSLSTILPTNFFHFLRLFAHVIMLRETAMQEENSQAESISYLFTSRRVNPREYRDKMQDNFKRLNFTNSFVVMACAPTVVIVLCQFFYIIINKIYEYAIEQSAKISNHQVSPVLKEETAGRPVFRVIRTIFVLLNTVSAVMIKNLLFLTSCSAMINLKCQYLVSYEQVFGYILSLLVFWGLLTYSLHLFSILSNRLHFEDNSVYKTYRPFLLYVDPESAIEEEWDEVMDTIELKQELFDRERHFASHYKTPNITFRFLGNENVLMSPEEPSMKLTDEDIALFNSDGSGKEVEAVEGKVALVLRKIQSFRRLYHLINLTRKVILVIFLVFFSGKFQGQMVPCLVLQVLFFGYVVILQPKDYFILNVAKIAAEVALLGVFIMLFISHSIQANMQSNYADRAIPDEEISSFLRFGSVMMAFMCFYFLVLLVANTYEIISSIKRSLAKSSEFYFPQSLQPQKFHQNRSYNEEEPKIQYFLSKKEFGEGDKIKKENSEQIGISPATTMKAQQGGQPQGQISMELVSIEKKIRKSLDYTKYLQKDSKVQFQFEIDHPLRNNQPFLPKKFKKNQ